MATVIGVRFKKAGKVYYFDPDGVWPRPGDCVIVETARGVEYGEVVTGSRSVDDARIVSPLKKVIRVASEEDRQRAENNERREKEAFTICQEKIARHKLDMKLVSVEITFDSSKIIFYFTANGRVDFRELVKDLASVFKIRIELRQIGVRDEAKMLGGLGSCGRPICCRAFLGDFQPVSIKMAKEQNLSLNPTKISGQCGRLMCCLKYEQDNYDAVHKRLPRVGKDVVTPDGMGVITEINAIKERVKVRIRVDDSFDVREYDIDDVRRPGPGDGTAERELPKPQERRPKRQPQEAQEAADADEAEGEGKKKRYPHQKAPKNLSTDQFLEKLKESGGATPVKGEHRRRKRGKGVDGETATMERPEAVERAEASAREDAPVEKREALNAEAVQSEFAEAPAGENGPAEKAESAAEAAPVERDVETAAEPQEAETVPERAAEPASQAGNAGADDAEA